MSDLSCSNKADLLLFLQDVKDTHQDWYLTINNKRLFLNQSSVLDKLFARVKRGEKVWGEYKLGFICTWGFSERGARKYIKLLIREHDYSSLFKLLSSFFSNYPETDFFIKVKKDSFFLPVLEKYFGFVFYGGRGAEVLLCRRVAQC
jgi:hypothetical protein